MPFLDSLDIANRAIQHCGVNPILSVTEDTTNNNEISAVYDKVRRAELRRNAWRFAIRKTVIRPITTTMLEIVPTAYSSSQLYKTGELVVDANNLIWVSTMADNIGNSPGGNNNAWDMFFGPMTADVWQPPTTGTVNAWASYTTYSLGQEAIGSDGNIYASTINTNLNNNPVTDSGVHWVRVGTFSSQTTYSAGELAYVPNLDTNLLLNSTNLLNTATWSANNCTLTANAGTDPVGGQTAVELTDNATNTNHYLQQSVTLVSGSTYTWSCYLKTVSMQLFTLEYGGAVPAATFSFVTGLATIVAGSGSATMTSVGNSWYRCTLTFVAGASTGMNFAMTNNSGNYTGYSGSGSSVLLWGPQLEPGSVANLYNSTPPLPQGYSVFMSLTNNNVDAPNIAQAWNSVVQYNQDQIVSYAGFNWRSLLPYNVGTTPAVAPAAWVATTTYSISNTVTGSDNYVYSAVGGTTGNNPVTDAGVHWTNTGVLAAWTNTPTIVPQDINWRYLSCTLKNLVPLWPVGSGPTNQTTTRNVYRLPAGYVGPAPQNPKQGVMTFLGGPSGNNEPDWELEGNFIVTVWSQPIVIRFVADVAKVTAMDDMFCEGLAARIAQMVCKRLTGSGELTGQIAQAYKLFMGEARLKNGIESGTQEPYEDDYVTVRI